MTTKMTKFKHPCTDALVAGYFLHVLDAEMSTLWIHRSVKSFHKYHRGWPRTDFQYLPATLRHLKTCLAGKVDVGPLMVAAARVDASMQIFQWLYDHRCSVVRGLSDLGKSAHPLAHQLSEARRELRDVVEGADLHRWFDIGGRLEGLHNFETPVAIRRLLEPVLKQEDLRDAEKLGERVVDEDDFLSVPWTRASGAGLFNWLVERLEEKNAPWIVLRISNDGVTYNGVKIILSTALLHCLSLYCVYPGIALADAYVGDILQVVPNTITQNVGRLRRAFEANDQPFPIIRLRSRCAYGLHLPADAIFFEPDFEDPWPDGIRRPLPNAQIPIDSAETLPVGRKLG